MAHENEVGRKGIVPNGMIIVLVLVGKTKFKIMIMVIIKIRSLLLSSTVTVTVMLNLPNLNSSSTTVWILTLLIFNRKSGTTSPRNNGKNGESFAEMEGSSVTFSTT
ncbi:hypothetical protein CCACVL1_28412 [Corchorus capsularis]|uniref:Transmembrane protein n=1 Tax=Corchorus capsularis TaxID=210143 RepID=A0A1R3G6S1_COCAP|nr:hypothetical protein CCACVL1_28412 [Corchorus capsularis]